MNKYQGLGVLVDQLNVEVAAKKRELTDLMDQRDILRKALRILEQKGMVNQGIMFSLEKQEEPTSDKYANKGLSESIIDIISSHNGRAMKSREIYNELMAGGYTSRSKDKKRDVLVAVNRLGKRGEITHTKKENIKHYTIKE